MDTNLFGWLLGSRRDCPQPSPHRQTRTINQNNYHANMERLACRMTHHHGVHCCGNSSRSCCEANLCCWVRPPCPVSPSIPLAAAASAHATEGSYYQTQNKTVNEELEAVGKPTPHNSPWCVGLSSVLRHGVRRPARNGAGRKGMRGRR